MLIDPLQYVDEIRALNLSLPTDGTHRKTKTPKNSAENKWVKRWDHNIPEQTTPDRLTNNKHVRTRMLYR